MNKLTLAAIMLFLALGLYSCDDQNSKQFNTFQKEIEAANQKINEVEDCDELQMLNIAILGMRSDLDNMMQAAELPDTELDQLNELMDGLEASWYGKWASLNCEQVMGDDELDTSGDGSDEFQDYDIL